MTKKPLPLYVRAVIIVGSLTIVQSLVNLHASPPRWEWVLFAALAVISGSFSLKIGSVSASITISDTFFICTALLFGASPATLAAAISTGVSSWRRRHRRDRLAFNVATTALGMWAGSHLFFVLAGIPPLIGGETPVELVIVPLVAFTTVYFIFNSGLVAVAIGLDAGKSPIAVWRQHFSWLSVNCFASASVSFCMLLLNDRVSFGAAAVVLPLLAVLHLTLSSSFGRLEDARRHIAHVDRLYLSAVETLAMAIDAKDDVTHSHVRRVQSYALGLARALGVHDDSSLKAIEAAALLHDTGKLGIPEYILNKPGKLTAAEFEEMKRHVDIGADILSLVDFPYPVVPIVRCHHENWDGSGYPRGISGSEIPIGARILSVVDCFDALTSDRPYRAALTNEQAFEILRSRSGTMYEPLVVETFIRIHHELAVQVAAFPQHEALRQITRSASAATASVPPRPAVAMSGVSDEVLAFVSLARLASGDGTTSDVLALASNLMRELAPGATIGWYLVDEATNHVVLRHAAGPAAHVLNGMSLRIGDGLSGWVAAHRQVIVNSEAALDLGGRARGDVPLERALGVPLIARESFVGTMTLYSGIAFTEDQSRLAQVIAPHLAQAIWTSCREEAQAKSKDESTVPAPANRQLNGSGSRMRLISAR
jgi:putative nucleotidyltransferase with HDIG domain